jgi:hypothetical protein
VCCGVCVVVCKYTGRYNDNNNHEQATKRTTSKIDWSILKSERYCRGKGGDFIGNRPNKDKEPHKGSGTLVRRAVIPSETTLGH